MTKRQLEKKLKHLKKEINYYKKVYPTNYKIAKLKSEYRYYKRIFRKIYDFDEL